MGISLRPRHLGRYKDIALLLLRHGRGDLVRQAGLDAVLADDPVDIDPGEQDAAERLASDLEQMGPTFVKLGQLLSTRADLLPAPYLEALGRLQDAVEPIPFEAVREVIAEELGDRLGLFDAIDAVPLASASLGQVHRATLVGGTPVAVKVQRPGIRKQVADDLEVLEDLADFLDRHTEVGWHFGAVDMLGEFRRALLQELDYRQEARNLDAMYEHLSDHDRVVVPRPVAECTTSRVLTMELVPGEKIAAAVTAGTVVDGPALADDLFHAYLDQMFGRGMVHADPHPGNVLVTADGRLALLDLGMVTRLGGGLQDMLLRLLLALGEGDTESVTRLVVDLGESLDGFDRQGLERDLVDLVGRYEGAAIADIPPGLVMMHLSRVAGQRGLRPRPELGMLGKALLNLDEVARTLDPSFDPRAAIRRHGPGVVSRHVWQSASGGMAGTALETKEFLERLPARLNRLFETVSRNELTIKVDALDETEFLGSMHKIANRITMGVVIAALIVGAAMLMRVDTEARILGYPALAMVCFLAAAIAGFALVISIVVGDRPVRRRERHRR